MSGFGSSGGDGPLCAEEGARDRGVDVSCDAIPYTIGSTTLKSLLPPWALDGGGVLMNQGIHLLDLLLWFMGDPEHIQARAATLRHGIEVEDTLSATLTFAGGAMATIVATTAMEPGFAHRVEIYGTSGGIQIEGEEILRWQTAAGNTAHGSQERTAGAGAGGDPRGIPITGHIEIVKNFIAAIRGKEALLVDGYEGMRSIAAVETIYSAAGLDRESVS